MPNYTNLFQEINTQLADFQDTGKVATYIPELGNVNPDKFGVHLTTLEKQHFSFGDASEKFSIQSIAKVLSLILAYNLKGENLWERVGVEPSGTPFNSLVQLEYDKGIPRNPLLNAGALVVCDVLTSHFKYPKADFLDFVRSITSNQAIDYNIRIAESEIATSFRNASLLNLMKDFNNIENDIERVLEFYCYLCSLTMTCNELACTFLFLANDGINPYTGESILSVSSSKRINAIMQLCGFYDEAGEFSFKVGLPGKSGVGGGIVAVLPEQYSIAVWSPRLNKKGNSARGMKFLELFTTKTGYSIF